MSELTDKQKRFVEEYLVDSNATQAAIRAGYSENSAMQQGYQLLEHTLVAAAVKERQVALADKLGITQEWIIGRFREISDRCMQAKPVLNKKGEQVLVEDKDGNKVPAYVFDSTGANKSTEMLGKHLGMFKERVEHSGSVSLASLVEQSGLKKE